MLSDLHGNYNVLLRMLETIQFDDTDKLYVLGDCNDRGTKAMEIYEFLKAHSSNIFLLKGNHELMMRDYLKKNSWECPEGRIWKDNGGVKTMANFAQKILQDCNYSMEDFELKRDEFLNWLLDYLNQLPSYYEINVNGKDYVLIHAGIDPELPLEEQDEEICAWIRDYFFMSPGLPGKTIIFGHTPTKFMHSSGSCFDIWYDPIYHDKIGIDGGLGPFPEGQLNCLCLDDMSVTVIKRADAPDEELAS